MKLLPFGEVSRSHGHKGAFRIRLKVEDCPQLKDNEPVFILLEGGPVPFFVQEFSRQNNQAILKVEDVDSIVSAEKLVGKEVLIPEDRLHISEAEEAENLIGFRVYDIRHGEIGKILGIMRLPQHPILEVEGKGSRILIPFVESMVKKIDVSGRSVTVETPDGLIDLYTNG